MSRLQEQLSHFVYKGNDVSELTGKFKELAPYFLSGGYIKVRDEYRIYLTTVEFYFHSEKDDGIKDPIVYHRNGRMVLDNDKHAPKLPYFPFMSLHAHDSGYDITFENDREQYRASALIRAYQVWDEKAGQWIKWDKDIQKFRYYDVERDVEPINSQVLYLKTFLNGFGAGAGEVVWEDNEENILDTSELVQKKRKGVKDDDKYWSFSRY